MSKGQVTPRVFAIAMECVRIGLHGTGNFIDVGESALQFEWQQWGEQFDKRTENFSEEEKNDYLDLCYDDLAMVRDVAPAMFRKASFVMLIGVWEVLAANLCRTLHGLRLVCQKPPAKLYHSKSRKYLTEKARFSDSAFQSAWRFCEAAACVRNVIIHNNGQFPSEVEMEELPEDLANAVATARDFIAKNNESIGVTDRDEITIKRGFCEKVHSQIEECAAVLLKEAERTLPIIRCA